MKICQSFVMSQNQSHCGMYDFRLHVVGLRHPRSRLEGTRCVWQNSVHELRRLQEEIRCG